MPPKDTANPRHGPDEAATQTDERGVKDDRQDSRAASDAYPQVDVTATEVDELDDENQPPVPVPDDDNADGLRGSIRFNDVPFRESNVPTTPASEGLQERTNRPVPSLDTRPVHEDRPRQFSDAVSPGTAYFPDGTPMTERQYQKSAMRNPASEHSSRRSQSDDSDHYVFTMDNLDDATEDAKDKSKQREGSGTQPSSVQRDPNAPPSILRRDEVPPSPQNRQRQKSVSFTEAEVNHLDDTFWPTPQPVDWEAHRKMQHGRGPPQPRQPPPSDDEQPFKFGNWLTDRSPRVSDEDFQVRYYSSDSETSESQSSDSETTSESDMEPGPES